MMHHTAQQCSVAIPVVPLGLRVSVIRAATAWVRIMGMMNFLQFCSPISWIQKFSSMQPGRGVNFCVPSPPNELVPPGLQVHSPSLLHSPHSAGCSHQLANDWDIGQESFLAQNSPGMVNLPMLHACKRQTPQGTATQSLYIEVPQIGQGRGPCTKAAN